MTPNPKSVSPGTPECPKRLTLSSDLPKPLRDTSLPWLTVDAPPVSHRRFATNRMRSACICSDQPPSCSRPTSDRQSLLSWSTCSYLEDENFSETKSALSRRKSLISQFPPQTSHAGVPLLSHLGQAHSPPPERRRLESHFCLPSSPCCPNFLFTECPPVHSPP
jgi:hypothetical protein